MKFCFDTKNTYSFSGASFAPSRRASENNTEIRVSDTAFAVSVLFSLILMLAIIMLDSACLISMLTVVLAVLKSIKKTSKTVI